MAATIHAAKRTFVAFHKFLMAPIVSTVLLNDLAHTLVWALDFMCSVFVTATFQFWQHHMHLFYGAHVSYLHHAWLLTPTFMVHMFFYFCVLLSSFFPWLFVAFGIYFVSDFYSVLVWVVLFVVWSSIVSCFSTVNPNCLLFSQPSQ